MNNALASDSAKSALGAMILDPNAIAVGLAALRHDAMQGRERVVLRALRAMYAAGKCVDIGLLARQLDTTGELDAAGGPLFLTDLLQYACALSNLEITCECVNRDAERIALRDACAKILEETGRTDNDTAEVLERAEKSVMAIRENAPNNQDPEPLAVILDRVLSGKRKGTKTGFTKFDWATGGMHSKQLITLGARPGMGKTSIACNIADHLTAQGLPVLFFSLEMDTQEIGARMIALQNVPLSHVVRGTPQVVQAALDIKARPLALVHLSRPTLVDLRAIVRRSRIKPAVVIVDFLQLVHPGEKTDNRAEAVENVARGLKWMACEFDLPVIALAQLNRNTEERGKLRRPVLSDLRESGGVEIHSDVVAFVHREKYYEPGNRDAELIIAKNRQGPIAGCKLEFIGEFASFVNPPVDVGGTREIIRDDWQ